MCIRDRKYFGGTLPTERESGEFDDDLIETATSLRAKVDDFMAALSKIQPRSFPSVVREGFNRSRRLVLRFSTDILWTA